MPTSHRKGGRATAKATDAPVERTKSHLGVDAANAAPSRSTNIKSFIEVPILVIMMMKTLMTPILRRPF